MYRGGAAGVAPSPLVTLLGDQTREALGRWVSGAGDVNGDGYADVIVGADGENGADTTASGWAYVYLGGPDGTAAKAATTLTGPDGQGSWFGRCVAGAGDVNGDGYADVVVGADAGNVPSAPTGVCPTPLVGPTSTWGAPRASASPPQSGGSARARAAPSAAPLPVRRRLGQTLQEQPFPFSLQTWARGDGLTLIGLDDSYHRGVIATKWFGGMIL